jgi:fatty acid-binding protein DegV
MMRSGEMITTSQINSQTCVEAFEEILGQGKDLLYIGFSSALSGSYSAGETAASELRENIPGQEDTDG